MMQKLSYVAERKMKRYVTLSLVMIMLVLSVPIVFAGCGSKSACVDVAVSPVNPTIVNGQKQQFTAFFYVHGEPSDATSSVTWSSSNPTVATISNAAGLYGLATAVSAGTTTIMAATSCNSASTLLTVQ